MIIKKDCDILTTIQNENLNFSSPCNGNGTCGKCKIKMFGEQFLNDVERQRLTPKEIKAGIRLACQQPKPKGDIEVQLVQDLSLYNVTLSKQDQFCIEQPESGIGVAVDIGTTTVAIAYLDLLSGKLLKQDSFVNPQVSYGADVLTRIVACREEAHTLSAIIRQAVIASVDKLCDSYIKKMIIVGNTTMTHIFMDEDVQSIGQSPYDYAIKDLVILKSEELGFSQIFPVYIIPPLAAFIGADIVAGAFWLDLEHKIGSHLLIDLGTNGEMLLANEGVLMATSTAAGPAFEGGNMVCGCGAIAGAIMEVDANKILTINQQKPIGICGSGYISIISNYLSTHQIENSGYFPIKELTIIDNLKLYQDDIRNFQLAKAAIAAGIETLLREVKDSGSSITKVYLAGGFSQAIKISDFINLGIFPQSFCDKVEVVGNSSLLGAIKLLCLKQISDYAIHVDIIDLASQPGFEDLYVGHMTLGRYCG